MNWFGLLLGIATLFIIALGIVWVIRGERSFGYLWWPYVMGFGVLLISVSVLLQNNWASALVGVTGGSLVWGATELKEQAVRAELDWYPFKADKLHPHFADKIKQWSAPHL